MVWGIRRAKERAGGGRRPGDPASSKPDKIFWNRGSGCRTGSTGTPVKVQRKAAVEELVESGDKGNGEDAMKALERICYHMAHDLRGPLRAIQGFSSCLMESYHDALNREGREQLDRISRASIRMEKLIQSLKEYGRLSQRKLVPRPVRLDRVMNAVISNLAAEVKATRARIEMRQPLPELWTSAALLEEILAHLLRNA